MSDEIVLYASPDGEKRVEVFYQGETVWLTQKQLAELYNVDRSVITKHPGNIFSEGELREDSVSAILAHTAEDGKTYQTRFYNLDAIIAVGYRVNSHEAAHGVDNLEERAQGKSTQVRCFDCQELLESV